MWVSTSHTLGDAKRPINQWNSRAECFTLVGMNVHLYATPDGFGPVARWVYRRDPVRFTTELTTLRTTCLLYTSDAADE